MSADHNRSAVVKALGVILALLVFSGLVLVIREASVHGWGILIISVPLTVLYYLWRRSQIDSRFNRLRPKSTLVIQSTGATLELLDATGQSARYTKTKEITTDAPEIRQYTETGLWSDGPLEDITYSDNVTCTKRQVPDRPNKYELDVILKKPLRRHQVREIQTAWTMRDSFRNETEFFTISISHPAKKYTFRIRFPHDRPVKSGWVEFTYLGHRTRFTDRNPHVFRIDSDHREVLFSMNQVMPGMKAIIMWEW